MAIQFKEFPKIPRLNRTCTITEKIDGTNAQIYIPSEPEEIEELASSGKPFLVGSRNRWITPENDNYGFARWAYGNANSLLALGPGQHFGEWWGAGIQRGYGLTEKRFSLFNSKRWAEQERPEGVRVVPVLYEGLFSTEAVEQTLNKLKSEGSLAAPGFTKPEGVVVFMHASRSLHKILLENDDKAKGEIQ